MIANTNIDAGHCFCSFSYGLDKIWLFEMPDENKGFISGYLIVINTTPYFVSIAGGSERLTNYVAETYAHYLGTVQQDCDDVCHDGEGNWEFKENSDEFFSFIDAFHSAMQDAGYVMHPDSGGWYRKGSCYACGYFFSENFPEEQPNFCPTCGTSVADNDEDEDDE